MSEPDEPSGEEAAPADPARGKRGTGSRVAARVAARAGQRAREVKKAGEGAARAAANLPAVAAGAATGRAGEAAPSGKDGPPVPAKRRAAPRPQAGEARRPAPSRAARAAAAAALDAPMVPEESEPDPLGTALGVILRLASVAWLVAAVFVWGRLVGYADDVIDPAWHDPGGPWLTTLTAAVVYPVVAVGLWFRGRWGIVLWSSAVAAEVALLVLAPEILPFGGLALAANLLVLAALGALGVARALRRGERD